MTQSGTASRERATQIVNLPAFESVNEFQPKERVMKMWRIAPYGRDEIQEREVVKETAQQVQFYDLDRNGKAETRVTREFKAGNWFPTQRAAVTELIERHERRVAGMKSQYDAERGRLEEMRAKYADLLVNVPEKVEAE